MPDPTASPAPTSMPTDCERGAGYEDYTLPQTVMSAMAGNGLISSSDKGCWLLTEYFDLYDEQFPEVGLNRDCNNLVARDECTDAMCTNWGTFDYIDAYGMCPHECGICMDQAQSCASSTLTDDPDWESSYGDCKTYQPGEDNEGYCADDGACSICACSCEADAGC